MNALTIYAIKAVPGYLLYRGDVWLLLDDNGEIITASERSIKDRQQNLLLYAPDPMLWAEGIEAAIARATAEGRGEPIATLPTHVSEDVTEYARSWGWPVEEAREVSGEPTRGHGR